MNVRLGVVFRGILKESCYLFELIAIDSENIRQITLGTMLAKSKGKGCMQGDLALQQELFEQMGFKAENLQAIYDQILEQVDSVQELIDD